MTKQTETKFDRKATIEALQQIWPEAKLGKTSNEDLIFLVELAIEVAGDESETSRNMAKTLRRYREKYVDTMAYSGRISKVSGDEVSLMLAGFAPQEVMDIAERALDLEAGSLKAKYEKLNLGSQRMNAGNRIRAAIKRGDLTVEALKKVAGIK